MKKALSFGVMDFSAVREFVFLSVYCFSTKNY